MAPIAAIIGAVTAVAGTVASVSQQRKAARLSRQQQQVSTRRSQRQAIRQAQLQRAQAVASAQASGALGGSGASGGIGALSSQLGEQFGFSTQMSGLSGQISAAQSRANTFSGVASLGGTLYGAAQNNPGFFDKLKPTSPAAAGQNAAPYYQPGSTGPA